MWWWGLGSAVAQVPAVWSMGVGQVVLHEPERVGGRLWLDLHARHGDLRFTGIVRPGVGLDLSRSTTVTLGTAWVVGAPVDGEATHEHRPWQQVQWTGAAGPVGLTARGRLEQRTGNGLRGVGLRTRAMGRAQVPLAGPVAAVAWDEAFVAVNDSAFLPAGFDQNRLFLGPAVSGDGFRVEVGYLDLRAWREGAWAWTPTFLSALFFTL